MYALNPRSGDYSGASLEVRFIALLHGLTSRRGRYVIYRRNDHKQRGQEPRLVGRESRKPTYASV